LKGQKPVYDLFDESTPFSANLPPKYLRTSIFDFHFTKDLNDKNWWTAKHLRSIYFDNFEKLFNDNNNSLQKGEKKTQ